jgi:hypothetical protein
VIRYRLVVRGWILIRGWIIAGNRLRRNLVFV